MYNIPTITTSLAPVVGFRQQYDSQLNTLNSDLLTSSSGLWFQDAHALITLDNIAAVMPLETDIVFNAWDGTLAYRANDIVKDSNKLYYALKDTIANTTLLTDTNYWQATNWQSYWLRDKRAASIRQVVAAITQKQQLAASAKTLLDNNNLFEGSASFQDLETNMGRFVGFQIELLSDNNLVDFISKIGTQFSVASLPYDFNLYLYHTSQTDPVKVIPVTINKQLGIEWRQTDITIGYQTAVTDSGGKWFLGYYEADIDGNAVNKQYNFLTGPCNNCLGQETAYAAYRRRKPYATITPFAVAGSKLPGDKTLWDWNIDNVSYNLHTWGLNLTQTFKCDFTDFICAQAFLFARAILLQFACDMLTVMEHSPRTNRNQAISQAGALRALGTSELPGLYQQLQDEIASVTLNMEGLSPLCQPVAASRGVRYGSV